MPVRPLLIQVHWTDLRNCPELLEDDSISLASRARESFERVVVVCGDCPENAEVASYAQAMGVECFMGEIDDVASRIQRCMEQLGFQQAARALGYWFGCDTDLVHRCFDVLESTEADAVSFPRDFDARFGADVFSLGFLQKFREHVDSYPADRAAQLRFRPWSILELQPEPFHVVECRDLPVYDRQRFRRLSRIYNEYHPERFLAVQSPLGAYAHALELVRGLDRVADIACGWGDGAELLARECEYVVGVEYCLEQTADNSARFQDVKNLQFIAGDALDAGILTLGSLDAIVSIHTMEHLPDDRRFLENCANWLRPGGVLVLEVPLMAEYPFCGIDEPLGDKHFREYRTDALLELCAEHFNIYGAWGVARGLYVQIDRARNAVMLALRRRDH